MQRRIWGRADLLGQGRVAGLFGYTFNVGKRTLVDFSRRNTWLTVDSSLVVYYKEESDAFGGGAFETRKLDLVFEPQPERRPCQTCGPSLGGQ